MKWKIRFIVGLLLCGMVAGTQAQERKIRVACVGNSITYGYGIADRVRDSYPAVLGKLLGEEYEVQNFAVSGRTMLDRGNYPYMKEKTYQMALAFEPDVVIIKLGTNDSKPQNWKYKEEFMPDMKKMVQQFRKLSSGPVIYLCTPAKVYRELGGITDEVVGKEVVPLIKQVAKEEKLPLIDLYQITDKMPGCFIDGVHPNEQGAERIARAVYEQIKKVRFRNPGH